MLEPGILLLVQSEILQKDYNCKYAHPNFHKRFDKNQDNFLYQLLQLHLTNINRNKKAKPPEPPVVPDVTDCVKV